MTNVFEKIYEAKKIIKDNIADKEWFNEFTTLEGAKKQAYKQSLSLIENIEKEYLKEYNSRKNSKNVEIRFNINCLDREFVIEINEDFETIAKKIIEESYFYWCEGSEDVFDECCEEYIEQRLKYYGLVFKTKDINNNLG